MAASDSGVPRYEPRFSYTHEIVNDLLTIEGACRLVDVLALPPDAAFRLKYEARRRSTRYSTAIEGNSLTPDDMIEAVASSDRDLSEQQQEVRNYWNALEWLERQVENNARFTEDFIRRLHGIIIVRGRGRRAEQSQYRTGECPVVDSVTGQVDYGPPRPEDVPGLMAALVTWRNSPAAKQLPGPIRAGVLAYQSVTIHPFADGNRRTARALATAELWFSGYQMRGFLSVEEYYFQNLQRYYDSLQMGLDWDYYSGRNDPGLTPWLSYFVGMMARAASGVRVEALGTQAADCRPTTPWGQPEPTAAATPEPPTGD